MIYRIALICATLFCLPLFGQESEKITFSTITGKKYENVKVMRVMPDSIQVMSSSGINRISMAELPEDLQTRFGYDPEKAASFARQDAARQNAIRQRMAQEQQRMNAAQESNSQAVSASPPVPSGEWVPTNEYTPEFNDLLNKAEAVAGGRKISGSDRKSGAVYSKGRFRGKSKAELVEIVKTEYRKMYPGKSYFVLRLVSEESNSPAPTMTASNLKVLQSEIEALELEVEALGYEITALSGSDDPNDSHKFLAAQQKKVAKEKLLELKRKQLSGGR